MGFACFMHDRTGSGGGNGDGGQSIFFACILLLLVVRVVPRLNYTIFDLFLGAPAIGAAPIQPWQWLIFIA